MLTIFYHPAIAHSGFGTLSSKYMKNPGSQTLPLTKKEFLDSVLRLGPKVAAFDCDGTLWSGDAGERFFDWEINHGVVSAEVGRAMRARYLQYKAGSESEEDM